MAVILSSCNNKTMTQKELKTELDSVSYAVGMSVAGSIKTSFKDDFDQDLFYQGFMNATDSTNMLIEQAKVQQVLQAYFQKKQKAEQAKLLEEGKKNKEEGDAFLAENKAKEGVMTTDSGLQYMVMKEGNGEKPGPTSKVKVHYHGTLIDGTVFDSSVDRGEPSSFGVNQVIKGWTEGLQLMNIGSKYKFFIPSDLAYGANPRPGGVIKPNSALIFEVELLEITE